MHFTTSNYIARPYRSCSPRQPRWDPLRRPRGAADVQRRAVKREVASLRQRSRREGPLKGTAALDSRFAPRYSVAASGCSSSIPRFVPALGAAPPPFAAIAASSAFLLIEQ